MIELEGTKEGVRTRGHKGRAQRKVLELEGTKEGVRTRGHKVALIKVHCRLDMKMYSASPKTINEHKQ